MLAKIGAWIPTILLVIILAFAAINGWGVESVVILGLLLIQALVFVIPWAAEVIGRKAGERN